VQLSIEAASDEPGLALSRDGNVLLSVTWHTLQNHSKELLPNLERLLMEAQAARGDLSAIFVDVGPGGYAALRVGVSTAKALAHALAIPLVGLGRLELDAMLVARDAAGRRIVAVHRAGRGDIAWASYRNGVEEHPPRITQLPELAGCLRPDDLVTGDIDDAVASAIRDARASIASPGAHRVVALAAAGNARLAAGRTDDPTALVPLYLRAPAIGGRKQD